jgi:hypothetical protein
VFLRDGAYLGAIEKMQDWLEARAELEIIINPIMKSNIRIH